MKTLAVLLIALAAVNAANFISNALGDGMVLQRAPYSARIWGWTAAGAVVKVSFKSQGLTATADAKGLWRVDLPATPASVVPVNITVASSNGQTGALNNVLFGDVYVCSGQSNMQFTVAEAFNSTEQIALAANYPNIRLFTVGQGTISLTPLDEFETIEQYWSVASPSSVGHGDWSYFSAVCWFYGKDLYDNLQIPIGLVSSNWGGTFVQAWSSPEALAKCSNMEGSDSVTPHPEFPGNPKVDPNQNSVLWNAMIVPLLNMQVRGATWYQGEANSGQPAYYRCAFPAMIADWRVKWGYTAEQFTFFFVQLAPWWPMDGTLLAETRDAQVAALALPKVGFATAADLGDIGSPFNNIHPRNKETVGVRMSAASRAITYGQNVQYLGPTFSTWKFNSLTSRVEITYTRASVGGGLTTHSFTCPDGVPATACIGFEVLVDNQWVQAAHTIGGVGVLVEVPAGKTATGVRYMWSTWPAATVYNVEGCGES